MDRPALGTWVQYTGPDVPALRLVAGLQGQVIDDGLWPSELAVAFTSGPTVCLPASELKPASELGDE